MLLFSRPVKSNSLWSHGLQHSGLFVPHHLPKFAQVHVHCISYAIQSSYTLLPAFPSACNLPQHQGLFQWLSCSHQMTKVLEPQHQHKSFQWVFRVDFPSDCLAWPPCSPRDSQESSTVPQLKSTNSLALSGLYIFLGWPKVCVGFSIRCYRETERTFWPTKYMCVCVCVCVF